MNSLWLVAALLLGVAPLAAQAPALIPAPASVTAHEAGPFVFTGETRIVVDPGAPETARIARVLAALVGTTDEGTPAVVEADDAPPGTVQLRLRDRADLGTEGYELDVTTDRVTLTAAAPVGLFYGVQTLRQLMPPWVEYTAARPRPIPVPAVRVVDQPRFAWRGMMLDVARHFFAVEDVERTLDLMALYKLNRLHLHLSDDQGWRIEIPGRPALTRIGGRTEVGGGEGGFYTTADYESIVRYAAERFITVVPEIDLPGHTNAALASLPEINCDGQARPPYTGIRVGFSTVCVEKEETYAFVDDVVRELVARTPGPYVHLGGDEVRELSAAQYAQFMARAQEIVARHGKTFVAWDEVAEADLALAPGAVVQVWRPQSRQTGGHLARAVEAGARLVLSPADRVYLDVKYDEGTVLGTTWPGLNDTRDAYDWDPTTLVEGVPEAAVLGVEAPLWSETIGTIRDVEWMAFPRLAGVAEIGWSPREARAWGTYRVRLGAHGPRWTALGVNFYRAPEVPWAPDGVE